MVSKKILRRISEHIIAATAVNILGTVTQDIGLSDDELDYVQEHINKIAEKITVGDLRIGTLNEIVEYWKNIK